MVEIKMMLLWDLYI